MEKIIAFILCIIMLSIPGWQGTEQPGVEEGFLTPEDAILAFLDGLRGQDLDQALSVLPWEKFAAGAHFEKIILSNSYYTPESWPAFPGKSELLSDINAAFLLCQKTEELCSFLEALTYPLDSPEIYDKGVSTLRTGTVKTPEEAEALLASFDLTRLEALSGMDNIRVLRPDDATDGKYSAYKRLEAMKERFRVRSGANEVCERAVYFTIGTKEYVFAPVLGRYGRSWYIVSLSGLLATQLGITGASGPIRLVGNAVPPSASTGGNGKSTAPLLPWEEIGGETPEEAASLYLEGLRTGDLSAVMGAFAWSTMRQHSSLKEAALKTGYYAGKTSWPVFPDENVMLNQLDLAMLAKNRLNRLTMALADYLTDGSIYADSRWVMQRRLPVRDEEEAKAVTALFDESRMQLLSTLGNIRMASPNDIVPGYASESIQSAKERYRMQYGADELTEILCTFTIGEEEFVIMPQLLRYGDRWYISTMNSILSIVCNVPLQNCALCKLSAVK